MRVGVIKYQVLLRLQKDFASGDTVAIGLSSVRVLNIKENNNFMK